MELQQNHTQVISKTNLEEKYKNEFDILVRHGDLIGEWANVFEHCKKEGEVADVLAQLLSLNEKDKDDLVSAAILHDWYKRKEREAANAGSATYQDSEHKSYNGLIELGVSERVADIAHSVGSFVLNEVHNYDFIRKVMHFIDDVCWGDKLVELDERMDNLEASDRYKKLNEEGRAVHNGKTYFEVQMEVGHQIQKEIENRLNIPNNSLMSLIKSNL